ncbi:class I tRNA ligase family protein, partial [candidate division WWE3 bacterium]|nr:class I tRNA ligase family protein [candidate division WWE3 bacterium]
MYRPHEIEPKWQNKWEADKLYQTKDVSDKGDKPKFYCLDMFPYPSGAGLHVGHVEGYTATDIYSRYLRARGYWVLHPMGWDAFGLPAENYAIKEKIQPSVTTKKAIERFKSQMKRTGLSYDWSREINTSEPDYYKWTQWLFLLMYKNGLAYRNEAPVNWCPSCQTVLANEQVIKSGDKNVCERCGSEVVQKNLEQWFLRITDYAEQLLEGLNKIDWPEHAKQSQRNWIGKS